DNPSQHPFVGDREFRKISVGKGLVDMGKQEKVPYREILTSVPIWAIWAATACHYLVTQFSITYLPMYLVWVLRVPMAVAGLLSAVPLIVQFALKFVTGMISDSAKGISEIAKLRIFNTLAFWGTGAVLVACSFIPPSNQVLAVIAVLVAVSCQGFVSGGFPKAAVMVAKQYNTIVMAVMQVILCLALFGGSFLVPGLTPGNSFEEYRWVFWIYATALLVGNTVFCLLCSAEAAEWTKPEYALHKASSELGSA
ncbi:Protein Y51B9A.6 b, partial [Aphelenchoides avenae]